LRGINTTNLNASPYVVVDGVLVKMARNITPFASGYAFSNTAFINPLDIADVRVLQSGYNSVLYGGRASNGVIDLTTNKGVAGSTAIDVMARVGFQQADYNKMEMMGGEDFRGYLFDYMHGMGNTIVDLQQMNIFNSGHPKYNHSTNWLDMVKRNAMFQDYQIKMSGGDGDTRYMFGVGYSSQEGTIDPTAYNRFNMRINLDYKISQKISIANYLAYSYGTSRFYDQGNNWAVHPLYVALTKAPFLSPMYYDDNGIIWPIEIAPYHVLVVPVNTKDEASAAKAEEIYMQLKKVGLETVIDDRNERPGVKFKDADLIGYPLRVVVGPKTLTEGKLEVKIRKTGEIRYLPLDGDYVQDIKNIIAELAFSK